MSDRAEIRVVNANQPDLYLYSHWRGKEIALALKDALIRGRLRWEDGPYLTRIIFCELIKKDVLGENDYGIATYNMGTDHVFIDVEPDLKRVSIGSFYWSFEQFIRENNVAIIKAMESEDL
jgi:hypothetical protein